MSKQKNKKNLITTVIYYTIFIFLIYVIVLNIFVPDQAVNYVGFQLSNVQSGSMEPAFSKGDIIILTPVDNEDIKEGDIVIFYNYVNGERIRIVHRVIDIVTIGDETTYITKGDANSAVDTIRTAETHAIVPLTADMIIAKVPQLGENNWVLRIPLIGLLFIWIGEGLTFLFANPILLVLIIANLAIIVSLVVILVKSSKDKQKVGKAEEKSRIKAHDITDDKEHLRDDDEEDGSA